jgi:hypothetical protein
MDRTGQNLSISCVGSDGGHATMSRFDGILSVKNLILFKSGFVDLKPVLEPRRVSARVL